MFRYEISIETPVPFAAIAIGDHVKFIENPNLADRLPVWLQEVMANDVLSRAIRTSPRKAKWQHMAAVIPIETLRQNREVRCGSGGDVGV